MCIVNYWQPWFRALYGSEWPMSYCCIDTETSGWSWDRDVITEWGHVLVEDGQIIDRLSLIIDWTNHSIIPDHWLRSRLESLRTSMQVSGRECKISYELMQSKGMKPDKALAFIRDFYKTLQDKGTIFVGHGIGFDEKMLASNFIGFKVAPGFSFGDNGFLDTEGIEKASQCPTNIRVHPKSDDTLRSYFHRVKYTRVENVKSNMEVCFDKYKFQEKYGLKLENLHGAMTDSYCCHLLMKEFASQITDPQPPPIFPTEEQKQNRKPVKTTKQTSVFLPGKRLRGQRNS